MEAQLGRDEIGDLGTCYFFEADDALNWASGLKRTAEDGVTAEVGVEHAADRGGSLPRRSARRMEEQAGREGVRSGLCRAATGNVFCSIWTQRAAIELGGDSHVKCGSGRQRG